MSTRRVVITGLGAVTPLANNVADTWDGIVNGRSGIGPIDSFDISSFATTFGGVIRNFDIGEYIPVKDAKRMDGFVHYGIAAGCQAFEDSGIVVTEENAERIGVAVGASAKLCLLHAAHTCLGTCRRCIAGAMAPGAGRRGSSGALGECRVCPWYFADHRLLLPGHR